MYKPLKLFTEEYVSIAELIEEFDKATAELQEHCKLIAQQQAIIADLMNRIKLLEEDMIKRSCC